MENIQKSIPLIFVIGAVIIYIYTHLFIPKYPIVNKDNDINYIKECIEKNIENEIKIYARESLSGGSVSKSEIEDIKIGLKKLNSVLNNCRENKECYIDAYNDFMCKFVSKVTKTRTRYIHMKDYGIIGQHINTVYSWSY